MGEIAGIFTGSVGPWMMTIFMIGAFAATFSTAFNYFDGWPRIVGACCRNLFRPTAALAGTAADQLTVEHRRRWYPPCGRGCGWVRSTRRWWNGKARPRPASLHGPRFATGARTAPVGPVCYTW